MEVFNPSLNYRDVLNIYGDKASQTYWDLQSFYDHDPIEESEFKKQEILCKIAELKDKIESVKSQFSDLENKKRNNIIWNFIEKWGQIKTEELMNVWQKYNCVGKNEPHTKEWCVKYNIDLIAFICEGNINAETYNKNLKTFIEQEKIEFLGKL